MQVVLHTGAHFTDEERLLKCLLKNRKPFGKLGISLPDPENYRVPLRKVLNAMGKTPPAADARETLLDLFLADRDQGEPDRMILSDDSFFCIPRMAAKKNILYPSADEKLARFRQLFPNDQIELFIAIRNPATFLPAIFKRSQHEQFVDFLGGADPQTVRWSEMIARLKNRLPDIAITVWCNEDTPLIWGQLIREMAVIEPNKKIIGGFDLLGEIMTKEGMKRFRAYLKTHPVMTEMQKRRVIAAFLDKYALEDAIEEELDLPGWTEQMIAQLSDLYEEDLFEIQRLPGVNLITP